MSNIAPIKSLSFDSRIHDNKQHDEKKEIKSFSFASRTHNDFNDDERPKLDVQGCNVIEEEEEEEPKEFTLDQLNEDIDHFITTLSSTASNDCETVEIPNAVSMFLKKVETIIEEYESTQDNFIAFGRDVEGDSSFISALGRLSSLVEALTRFESMIGSHNTMPLLNQASSVLHRVMVFFEEELRFLLEEPHHSGSSIDDSNNNNNNDDGDNDKKQEQEGDHSNVSGDGKSEGGDEGHKENENEKEKEKESEEKEENESRVIFPSFSHGCVNNIRLISNAMIAAGYDIECCNVYIIARRQAFEEDLRKQGFEKMSVDEVQKMNWETLEGQIATWIRVFKHCFSVLFPGEHKFYSAVLSDHPEIFADLFSEVSKAVLSILINFAEGVSMAKRSTEKLFKFLDMYEILRDLNKAIDTGEEAIFPGECGKELMTELSFAASRLGEAAVSIFCQLENSIKSDNAKTPVACGAVHPLTRYTMNYLKYAGEYKDTLQQVFELHQKTEQSEDCSPNHNGEARTDQNTNQSHEEERQSPFATQLMSIMDLLDTNLEAKAKLYKDLSLRYIFLMNNGRYMLQKVKGSPEIHKVLGDHWCRKRSSDVRHYHKSYQRETWSRVLQCLNHEGLQVNGKIYKPHLKERFKNFNQHFDEIHRTQSTWVVSDEQLQSELRVSISAVMIPAYRSFVARFGQTFTAGRQTEKYIKYQPDDIENIIEELFDGNPASMVRRKT